MKKLIASLAASAVASLVAVGGLTLAGPASAGGASGCHFHGMTTASKETVSTCAVKRKEVLIAEGKIDNTWADAKLATLDQIDGKSSKEWRVTFTNPAASDKAKDTLYMFFTLQGNLIASNFSGK